MVIHLFGDRLKELRKNKSISQEELGNICGVAKNTVSYWEKNINQPSIEIITKLADYFDVTTDYLLGFNQNDIDNIKKLKIALKEAGMMVGDDLTKEELQKALDIVEMLKEKK